MSLAPTSLQETVPKPTLATEMEVDPRGVLDPLDFREVIGRHSPKLWPSEVRKIMLKLRTEGPYGSGLHVKRLGRDETTHESKGHHSVPRSSISVLVSQFVGDCSLSESKYTDHRLIMFILLR
jgi:hypothetical protein